MWGWALVLAACGGPASKNIEGTLSAPGSLRGSQVLVCPVEGSTVKCSDERAKQIEVSATGRSAPYKAEGLEDLDYVVAAFKDNDGDGNPTPGDYLDYYGYPNDPKRVPPPSQGHRHPDAGCPEPAKPPGLLRPLAGGRPGFVVISGRRYIQLDPHIGVRRQFNRPGAGLGPVLPPPLWLGHGL